MRAHQFDFVASLGSNCRNTWNVRDRYKLGKSYPFDWWITPTKSMLAMLRPGFVPDVQLNDLRITTEPNGTQSIYDTRRHALYQHDFPIVDRKVLPITEGQVADFNTKYARRFARLHADLAAASNPLLVTYPAGGWIDRGNGDNRFQHPLNGTVDHQTLIDEVRDILGAKCRVLIVADCWTGESRFHRLDGGAAAIVKDDGTRRPDIALGHYSEPANVFRAAFDWFDKTLDV